MPIGPFLPAKALSATCRDEVAVIAFSQLHLLQLSHCDIVEEGQIVSKDQNLLIVNQETVLNAVSLLLRSIHIHDRRRFPLRKLGIAGKLDESCAIVG